ncbi:MAG: hypothetical protein AB1772_04745 [Candidatus Zixiibacteriota bacterium]
MKKFAVIAFVGSLLVVGSVWASQVTNVEISYQAGSTVARIDIQGPVRFTHQTEVPKDGRPDRVIVDVLSATHELGAKEFSNLPPCIIKGVRSSQYAVNPERIVRIVFDLKTTPVYSVTSDDKSIVVTFSSKEEKPFPTWSSLDALPKPEPARPVTLATVPITPPPASKPPVTTTERNQNIEKDRLASLTPKSEAPKVGAADTKKSATQPFVPAPSEREVDDKPTSPGAPVVKDAAKASPEPTATEVQATGEQKPADKPAEKPAPASVQPAQKPNPEPPFVQPPFLPLQADPKDVAVQPALPEAAKPTVPATTTGTENKPVPAVKTPKPLDNPDEESTDKADQSQPSPPDASDFAPAVELPASVKPEDLTKVKVVEADSKASDTTKQRATARFRREAQSDKIRGTMVAEFPQRLVIKYQTDRERDPFTPLVDKNQTFNDPVENRIPNVEGLKLVGVLESDGGTNRALFEDKSGFSYILQTGDKVRNGYVLRVEEDQVYFQIFEYGWSRTVALTMEY